MDVKVFKHNKEELAGFYGSLNYWSNALGELHHHGEYDIEKGELPAALSRVYDELFFDGDFGSLRYLVETQNGFGIALVNEYDECYADDCNVSMDTLFRSAIKDADVISTQPEFETAEILLGERMGFDNSHILVVVLPADISVEAFRCAAGKLDELVYQAAKTINRPSLTDRIQDAEGRATSKVVAPYAPIKDSVLEI